tara:strand:+ start:1446 stop:1709 length:264 start_codon:yes stop_codon:yes gene_type:complete
MAAKRDYKAEYKKFHSSAKAKKKRAAANAGRKKLGLKKGDKRDASHKSGGRVVAEHRSKNRGSNCAQPGDRNARSKGSKKRQPKKKR